MRGRGASSVYLLLSGASSLFYPMVWFVGTLYMVQDVGLDAFQIVLAGTVQQAVNVLFQAPTGVLADMYGRRRTVVLGFLVIGGGFLLQGAVPTFAAILISQALTGFGHTLVDGADAAWIADELGAEAVGALYLRAAQLGSLAALLGIGIATALGAVRLNLPILASGGLFVALSLTLAAIMPERHFTPAPRGERNPWQQAGHTLRAGLGTVRARPALRTILGIGVFAGLFSAGFDPLWQYHLLRAVHLPRTGGLTPVVWFGLIEAGITLTNLLGAAIARRRVDTASRRAVVWALCTVDGLTIACGMTFALAGQIGFALAAFFAMTTARGPRVPLERIWMNEQLDAGVRATVFSLRGQVSALTQIAGGPMFGALATADGTRAALLCSAAAFAPALLLYARALRTETPTPA